MKTITTLYENILKKSKTSRRFDEKEANDIKLIKTISLDKHEDLLKTKKVTFEIVFGEVLGKEATTAEQITKPSDFLAGLM